MSFRVGHCHVYVCCPRFDVTVSQCDIELATLEFHDATLKFDNTTLVFRQHFLSPDNDRLRGSRFSSLGLFEGCCEQLLFQQASLSLMQLPGNCKLEFYSNLHEKNSSDIRWSSCVKNCRVTPPVSAAGCLL